MFDNFFKNKRIFVTGHTGFIGSWLTLWLKDLGSNVMGYALDPPTRPSLFEILNLANKIEEIRADISDEKMLSTSMQNYKPDFVIHLAAQSLVRSSYDDPLNTFKTNIIGTANVLDSIRKTDSVKSCVVFTSDKCYENKETRYAYKENDPMGGSDPYSASKGAAELVVSSFRRSFFKKKKSIATVRAGNVIGGGDWSKDRLIPDIFRALYNKQEIPIRNPEGVRPWQYVLEPISGIFVLLQKLTTSDNYDEGWNLGPTYNNDANVKTIVTKVIDIWKSGTWSKMPFNDERHEAHYLRLDSTKARERIGWRSIYDIDETINETTQWYYCFSNKRNEIQNFTKTQIRRYYEKAKLMNAQWAQ